MAIAICPTGWAIASAACATTSQRKVRPARSQELAGDLVGGEGGDPLPHCAPSHISCRQHGQGKPPNSLGTVWVGLKASKHQLCALSSRQASQSPPNSPTLWWESTAGELAAGSHVHGRTCCRIWRQGLTHCFPCLE
jgi:hypothetical protein